MATDPETMMSDDSRKYLLASFKLHQLFDISTFTTVGLVELRSGFWLDGRAFSSCSLQW